MLTKILSATLLLLTAISLQAQKLHLGIKTDLDYNKVSGNGMSGKYQTGYQGGAFAEIDFNKKWGFQPEVLFSQRNVKRADNFSVYYVNTASPQSSQMVKLSYIAVPLLAKYNINDLFSVNFGPQVSFLVYDDEDLLKADQAAFKKIDLSLVAGVQLNLSDAFRVYGRYNYGISNINNIDSRYSWKTRQMQLGIGMHIF